MFIPAWVSGPPLIDVSFRLPAFAVKWGRLPARLAACQWADQASGHRNGLVLAEG